MENASKCPAVSHSWGLTVGKKNSQWMPNGKYIKQLSSMEIDSAGQLKVVFHLYSFHFISTGFRNFNVYFTQKTKGFSLATISMHKVLSAGIPLLK